MPCNTLRCFSTAACRLRKLDTISLTVEVATPRQPARQRPGVVSLLRTARKHLGNLRKLKVVCKQSWQGASKVWQELGLFTQLTGLDLDFPNLEVSLAAVQCAVPNRACLQAHKLCN
jgi:hypothetical protein